MLLLRERLRPYIMEQMETAATVGLPVMRPMFVDFPDDPNCWEHDDQYMFGRDILVAPVVEPGATEREVYLPTDSGWQDAWTGSFKGSSFPPRAVCSE